MFSIEIFSKRIKQLRLEKGKKQVDIAEFLGVTNTQISELENGKTSTTMEKLCLIADYFDVSIDYLVGHSETPERK